MSNFSNEYKAEKDSNGKWTIYDVPFFKIGKHKGIDYDEQWVQTAIARSNKLQDEEGYMAPVFVGHTDPLNPSEERPSVGLMSQIRLVGDTLFTNISNIADDIFDSLKNVIYPYRSAEMVTTSDGGIISGLALTSSNPPYFKFPPMNLKFNQFGDDLSPETIVYEDDESDEKIVKMFVALSRSIEDLGKTLTDHLESSSKGGQKMSEEKQTTQDYSELIGKLDAFSNAFDTMTVRMEENEKTTKVLAETLINERDARAREQKDARNSSVVSYIEDLRQGKSPFLKGKAVAPAILETAPFIQLNEAEDVKVTFNEDGVEVEKSVYDAVKGWANEVFTAAENNTLFITPGETVKSSDNIAEALPSDQEETDTVDYVARDAEIRATMISIAGDEDKYEEVKKDYNRFNDLRRQAFIELDIDED